MSGAPLVTYFDPQPARAELPDVLASPFAHGEPHPLARRAADETFAIVQRLDVGLERDGKMFGVLVVADRDGRIGYLRAFSGMLAGSWLVDGFAPPVFDREVRDAVWLAGERELDALTAELAAHDHEAEPRRRARAALQARHAAELDELRARHRANREARSQQRAHAADAHALDQLSRGDKAERRRLLARHADELRPMTDEVARLDAEARRLVDERTARSQALFDHVIDSYVLANARGERARLRDVFAPELPPGGAGDCAAPKLLAAAYRERLRPLALAEIWWGASPATGGRHHGRCYPACRGKCGPVLGFMLQGLAVERAPVFATAHDTELRVVHEDPWLVVVDKPAGMLSVPGRDAALADSVQSRLRARDGDVRLVHRLDLDTSGLLVAAKDAASHAVLQAQFARREVGKRYVAWVDGAVTGDHGTIELALRVDLDDRPRQIHDPVHGKPAITEWRVLARTPTRTKLALCPRTGRTHQLRVHTALGLGAPIVGDRLYGHAAERLLLHAEALTFTHPHTGERVELESPAPF
ncbi:MAG TPA: RluA family pseudouridine synthase [Kofleriaceae bacterium]|nr:RluA family pseudouridine synthase [Kofleriaceae bacterium]